MQFFNLDTDPGECNNLIGNPNYQAEVSKWKSYLINELADRNCNWVKDGELISPPPAGPLVSPYKNERYQG